MIYHYIMGNINQKVHKKKLNLGLPLNKAIAKGFGAIDSTTQRSGELFIQGVTKIKDTTKQTKLLSKFGVKKGKKTLSFVEKSKFALDRKGEKKGLSLSRALKPKKKKVVKKKKK